MVPKLRYDAVVRTVRRLRSAGGVLAAALVCLATLAESLGQVPNAHYRYHGDMPPGAIGRRQLQRGGPLPGFFQPIEVRGPEGSEIAFAVNGQFEKPRPGARHASLLVGSVYRLRVIKIPAIQELIRGMEVFPTIEVIDRLYPPPNQAYRFPIPIDLTQEDLRQALLGNFVTRVIALEDPQAALPAREHDKINWFETPPGEDPLMVAELLGRPVAILRIGARVPAQEGPDMQFLYGSPPLLFYQPPKEPPVPARPKQDQNEPKQEPAAAAHRSGGDNRQSQLPFPSRQPGRIR